MQSTFLIAQVDSWSVQAVAASRWLARFYRTLGDDHQAAIAIQAGAPALERLNRLRLQGQIAPQEERFSQDYSDETEAEQAAWTTLIAALAGLSAFFAVTADPVDGKITPGLRGARTATYGAYRKAVQGVHTAFPTTIAETGVASAIQKAIATCVAALMANLYEENPCERDQLQTDMESCVREALEKAMKT